MNAEKVTKVTSTIPSIKQSTFLKVAAISVAAPRYMGSFGVAAGADILADYAWLESLEVWSGLPMAILEGWAITYIFSKWRLLPRYSLEWYTLAGLLIALLGLMPFVAAPYLLLVQSKGDVTTIFGGGDYYALQVIWVLLVSLIPVLIIAGVGMADVDTTEQELAKLDRQQKLKLAKQEVNQETKQKSSKPFACDCGRAFSTYQGLNGHKGKCKLRRNGHKQKETKEVILNGKPV